MKTHLDWSAYDSYGIGDAYSGIPASGGNYAKAVAVCMNNRQCQREGKGVMCPSYRISGDEAHSTGARVRAFKAALNGELGDEPFASPVLAEAMDLCISCKGCKKECPSAVDMTLIKTEYLAQRNDILGVPLRARLFASLPHWLHRWRGVLTRLVAWHNRFPPIARVSEKLLGISARRQVAAPSPAPFQSPSADIAPAPRGDVLLFVDTFAHHFEPRIAAAAHAVLTAAGYRVKTLAPDPADAEPTRPLCCGRSYLSAGMVDQARVEARRVMAAVKPYLDSGMPIVGLEPSCLLALRDEFYSLGLGADVARLSKQVFLFEEFLMREANKGMTLPLKPRRGGMALVHGHCHQKAFGGMKSVKKVLAMIPEFEFEMLDASCCGMGGSFGLEAEHYEASRAMGELSLLPLIRAAAADAPIIADGFSCRHQILEGSGRRALHVAVLLQQHLP
ncbi:MAG: (Fe-S)-binding protein [Rhodocyclaceae bacterium]|nr:(Fe-S)-binding protein [Rhodocyclaceae bacterium]